jgi:vitamin B12 transporter
MKPRSCQGGGLALALATLCPALLPESALAASTVSLKPVVVSALRSPRDPSAVTSWVTSLDPAELRDQGIVQLRDALNASPGVISTSTSGQTGASGALFIRGTSTKYAQMVVDGMRLSDSNNQLNQILGNAGLRDLGTLEVLRGPQGAVHGGESIGGVIWMETPRGEVKPGGRAGFEVGSFQSITGHAIFEGEANDHSYFLSGGWLETDNDAPHHDLRQANSSMRLETRINPEWVLGATLRIVDSDGQDLDSSYSREGVSQFDSALTTLRAVGELSASWTARFHFGYYQEFYDQAYTVDDWITGLPVRESYDSDLRVGSFSTDHEIELADRLRMIAGLFHHEDRYRNSFTPDRRGERSGSHGTLEWDAAEALTLTTSLRWEDYDAFGDQTTWRTGAVGRINATGTTIKTGVGTSFRTPTYAELYGSAFNPANPDLEKEDSKGWEFGFEQSLSESHLLEVTWFRNLISKQIYYPSFDSAAVNEAGTSVTDGLECGVRGAWLDGEWGYRLAWTYLHESLAAAGLPKHAAHASLVWNVSGSTSVGIGAHHLSDHSWGLPSAVTTLDGYTLLRLFASHQLTDSVKFHARIENLLDQGYDLFNGYGSRVPGASRGIYAGITFDW